MLSSKIMLDGSLLKDYEVSRDDTFRMTFELLGGMFAVPEKFKDEGDLQDLLKPWQDKLRS